MSHTFKVGDVLEQIRDDDGGRIGQKITITRIAPLSNYYSTPAETTRCDFWDDRYLVRNFKLVSSPSITKFSTGAIRDSQDGKIDFIETLSYTALARYCSYMTGKKKKYGAGNFKKGIPIDSYEKSLVRHLHKYMVNKYENGSEEPLEDHMSAIVFNAMGILHEEAKLK